MGNGGALDAKGSVTPGMEGISGGRERAEVTAIQARLSAMLCFILLMQMNGLLWSRFEKVFAGSQRTGDCCPFIYKKEPLGSPRPSFALNIPFIVLRAQNNSPARTQYGRHRQRWIAPL